MAKAKPLTLQEIQKSIKELNSLDLDNADYENIRDLVDRLIIGRSINGFMLGGKPIRFYRGVLHKDKPMKTTLLSYPPAHLVTGFQRANPPGRPMFYCGIDPRIPFFELNISSGDKIYLSKWSARKKFAATTVEFGEGDNALDVIVKTYLQTKLSQRIHEVFSSDYKITCAIAEKLSNGTVEKGKMPDMGALVYPTVSMAARPENLAIRPEIVDKCLILDYVQEYLVKEINGNNISLVEKDFANQFPDGSIQWKGRPGHLGKLQKKGDYVTATASSFGWVVKDKKGNLIDPV